MLTLVLVAERILLEMCPEPDCAQAGVMRNALFHVGGVHLVNLIPNPADGPVNPATMAHECSLAAHRHNLLIELINFVIKNYVELASGRQVEAEYAIEQAQRAMAAVTAMHERAAYWREQVDQRQGIERKPLRSVMEEELEP